MERLLSEIELLKAEKKSLQEAVGRWKRKALGAKANFAYVSERHESGIHYISVPLPLPADDPLHEVQEFVRSTVLPKYYPYRYHNVYSSKRYGGWIVTMKRKDNTINMDEIPASLGDEENV